MKFGGSLCFKKYIFCDTAEALWLLFQLRGWREGWGVGSLSINTARGRRRAAPYKIVISAGTTGVKLRAARSSAVCMQILLRLRLLPCVRFSFSSCSLIKDANHPVKARHECGRARGLRDA